MTVNITEKNLSKLAKNLGIPLTHGWKTILQRKLLQKKPSILSTWIKRGLPNNFDNILIEADIDPKIWDNILKSNDIEITASKELRIPVSNDVLAYSESFVLIPKYKPRLSGGSGSYELSRDIENYLAFDAGWLNRKCQRDQCAIFEVNGDSMSPLITHGDVVLVDLTKHNPDDLIDGKIYAFAERDRVRIKRLIRRGDYLLAISENKMESPDGTVESEGFRLIGKVIWVGHEIK